MVPSHSRPNIIVMFTVRNRETSEIIILHVTKRRALLSVPLSMSGTKFQECGEQEIQDC
jgi:hypothetical protein